MRSPIGDAVTPRSASAMKISEKPPRCAHRFTSGVVTACKLTSGGSRSTELESHLRDAAFVVRTVMTPVIRIGVAARATVCLQ